MVTTKVPYSKIVTAEFHHKTSPKLLTVAAWLLTVAAWLLTVAAWVL